MSYYVLGNWKANGTKALAAEFASFFKNLDVPALAGFQTGLALPHHLLDTDLGPALTGAENVSHYTGGAYTGEMTVSMLKETRTSFCLVGHSERRQFFSEDETLTALKLEHLLAGDVLPVLCIGETLKQRQAGHLEDVLKTQLEPLRNLQDGVNLVVAYEPVWAIGTGVAATPQDVEGAHRCIKGLLAGLGFPDAPVLYGGSVKAGNAEDLASIDGVDGFLVGGASLKVGDFDGVIRGFIQGKGQA